MFDSPIVLLALEANLLNVCTYINNSITALSILVTKEQCLSIATHEISNTKHSVFMIKQFYWFVSIYCDGWLHVNGVHTFTPTENSNLH